MKRQPPELRSSGIPVVHGREDVNGMGHHPPVWRELEAGGRVLVVPCTPDEVLAIAPEGRLGWHAALAEVRATVAEAATMTEPAPRPGRDVMLPGEPGVCSACGRYIDADGRLDELVCTCTPEHPLHAMAAALRAVANGRRHYADAAQGDGTDSGVPQMLEAEADAFDLAADLVQGHLDAPDFLRASLPAAWWGRYGVDLTLGGA